MCQALPKEKWMDKRREDVLEAPYFHVVFTVPQELNPLIHSNQQLLYDALYHSVSATINELTADTKHLGARVGYICVLHTWGSEMNYHPHIHVILLGGGLTAKNQWRDKGEEFFLPVKIIVKKADGRSIRFPELNSSADFLCMYHQNALSESDITDCCVPEAKTSI